MTVRAAARAPRAEGTERVEEKTMGARHSRDALTEDIEAQVGARMPVARPRTIAAGRGSGGVQIPGAPCEDLRRLTTRPGEV